MLNIDWMTLSFVIYSVILLVVLARVGSGLGNCSVAGFVLLCRGRQSVDDVEGVSVW